MTPRERAYFQELLELVQELAVSSGRLALWALGLSAACFALSSLALGLVLVR